MEWASFLYLGELPRFFVSLQQLPTFYPLLFRCREISPRLSLLWRFCQRHFLWDIFIFLITTTLLTASITSPSSHSSGCMSSLFSSSSVNIFMVSYYFSSSIYAALRFHFQHYYILFLGCTFIFSGQVSFFNYSFFKMSCQFITRKQWGNTITSFSICVWTE